MTIDCEIVTLDKPVKLSNGTVVNRFSHVCKGAQIGDDCMIGEHVYIASGAVIGERVRIQNINNIWNGVELGDDVFIAPAVCLTNHHDPRGRFTEKHFTPDKTIIGRRATVCTNATIVAPCIIGENSMIAAASIILANVPSDFTAYGIWKGYGHDR